MSAPQVQNIVSSSSYSQLFEKLKLEGRNEFRTLGNPIRLLTSSLVKALFRLKCFCLDLLGLISFVSKHLEHLIVDCSTIIVTL